ncbi:PREDICTED: tripartite motif-containing protein 16-like [Poecilia mexicana]|uniref:tripartite motif-containing protein 16-like n=1 Tax=Poecilia mexicana TaxID=48701 RepID=UPI00072E7E5E|nr:PREDICTED: tripartite motif-containing protein 16-like [Poecilia mexicana]
MSEVSKGDSIYLFTKVANSFYCDYCRWKHTLCQYISMFHLIYKFTIATINQSAFICEEVKYSESFSLRGKMAQAGVQLDRKRFSCSICLDLLKDPVTTSCGHSYCMSCIKDHWDIEDQKGTHSCPQCRKTFNRRPDLQKNTLVAKLVEDLKKTGLRHAPADHCYAGPGDVACDVCTGRKMKAVKSCLVCLASYCEDHLQPHYESHAFKKHKLVKASAELQQHVSIRHDEVMKIFCRTDQQSICYLCTMDEHKGHETVPAATERAEKQKELQVRQQQIQHRIQNREKDMKLLQKEVEVINVSADKTNVPKTVPLVDVLQSEPEPKTRNDFLKYSKRITLDPDTANNFLLLSEGNRKVTLVEEDQFYFDHPDRFSNCTQILSRESLTGHCYWEVEWRGTEVDLAVSYKNISRSEGDSDFRNTDKSWTLYCHRQIYIFYHNRVETQVLVPVSSRVGVYLDHRAGVLSFYHVSGTMTLLHRVQTCFTQPLHTGVGFYSYGDSAKFIEL